MVVIHGLGANPCFSSIVQLCILHPERAKVPKQDHKKVLAVVGAGKHESRGLTSGRCHSFSFIVLGVLLYLPFQLLDKKLAKLVQIVIS